MDRDGFRKSLGLLGMVQDALLCHQLFRVFNKSGTGQIDFQEFTDGLGILMKGTMDEKLDFSFAMTDIDGSGEITFEELVLTVDSMGRIYAGIMGSHSNVVNKEKIKDVFCQLDVNNDGKINLQEYKIGMQKHPEFVATLRGIEFFRPVSAATNAANKKAHELEKAMDHISALLRSVEADLQLAVAGGGVSSSRGSNLGGGDDRLTITALAKAASGLTSPSPSLEEDEDSKTTSNNGGGDEVVNVEILSQALEKVEKARRLADMFNPARAAADDIALARKKRFAEHLLRPMTMMPPTPLISTPSPSNSSLPSSVGDTLVSYDDRTKTATMLNAALPQDQHLPETKLAAVPVVENALPPFPPTKTATIQETLQNAAETATNLPAMLLGQQPQPSPTSVTSIASKASTVYFGHKNWDLVVNVMKGIQMAVSRSILESDRPVDPRDFEVKEKFTLVTTHDRNKKNAGDSDLHRTRFVDYAPFVFAKLREYFNIDHEEYVNSIGPGSMLSNLMLGSLNALSEIGSDGKSGSFFYLSSDGRFLVKTIRKDEHKLLRHILPSYFRHMTRSGHSDNHVVPESMLTKIVGCHVVRSSKRSKTRTGAHKVYFVVMTNALETDLDVHRRYDLKGSWVGRKTNPKDVKANPSKTLKDLDFLSSRDRVFVNPEMKIKLMQSLQRDAEFLEQHHIIDYSVLLGIHDHRGGGGTTPSTAMFAPAAIARDTSEASFGGGSGGGGVGRASSGKSAFSKSSVDDLSVSGMTLMRAVTGVGETPFFAQYHGGFQSNDLKQTYLMGTIDFLTQYDNRKRAERLFKSMVLYNPQGISVMPARSYAKRFLKFLDEKVIVADFDRQSFCSKLTV